MIRKALEVAYEVGCVLCDDVTEADCANTITADRLAIVERLRQLFKEHRQERPLRLPDVICSQLEAEIRAAAASKEEP